jgi:hypothetical protein
MRTYTVVLDPGPRRGWLHRHGARPARLRDPGRDRRAVSRSGRRAEAIAVHLEGLRLAGEPIPDERDHPQLLTVSVAS